ncbi:MAG: hypothetical protein RMX96_15915 [Nostoc sp. ChiSLP02]|nr:hypothetical protein [Nostoc sp. DedSLP05]MDZ8098552.1 hypothetical protein [Nostoc sp. DedSLP01]MDZ8186325.1 hypothetical protein [Nostoc sp. ChiSLP02]
MFFNKEWLRYSDLTFTKNSPQGHLPLGGVDPKYHSLFSRVETCKL